MVRPRAFAAAVATFVMAALFVALILDDVSQHSLVRGLERKNVALGITLQA